MNFKRNFVVIIIIIWGTVLGLSIDNDKTGELVTPHTYNVATISNDNEIGAIATDKYIFVIARDAQQKDQKTSSDSRLLLYSFVTKQWSQASDLPSGVVIQDLLYAFKRTSLLGGSDSRRAWGQYLFIWAYDSSNRKKSATGLIFDAEQNKWMILPTENAPSPHSITPVKNGFLVYGRKREASSVTDQSNSAEIEIGLYDIPSNRWVVLEQPEGWIPFHSIQWKDDIVFLMRKKNEDRSMFIFSPQTGKWTCKVKLPFKLHGVTRAITSPKGIYYLSAFLSYESRNIIYRIHYLDFEKNCWESYPELMSHYQSIHMGFADNNLFVMYEPEYPSSGGNQLLKLDLYSNSWIPMVKPPIVSAKKKPFVQFIPDRNAFLVLSYFDEQIKGFLWFPTDSAEKTINLNGYRKDYDWVWNGSELVGVRCYRTLSQVRHAFYYNPAKHIRNSIYSTECPSEEMLPLLFTFQKQVFLFNKLDGGMYSFDFEKKQWSPMHLAIPDNVDCRLPIKFYATDDELFIQCRTGFLKTNNFSTMLTHITGASEQIIDVQQHDFFYFTTNKDFFRIITPSRTSSVADSDLKIIVEKYDSKNDKFNHFLDYTIQFSRGYRIEEINPGIQYVIIRLKIDKKTSSSYSEYPVEYVLLDITKKNISPILLHENMKTPISMFTYDNGIAALTHSYIQNLDYFIWTYSNEDMKWSLLWDSINTPKINIDRERTISFGNYAWFFVEQSIVQQKTDNYIMQINFSTGEKVIIPDNLALQRRKKNK